MGIGASAGGLAALKTLFDTLPPNLGLSYVVILHLSPEHHSEMASILGPRTRMPVTMVERRTPLEPDHVYLIAPDRQLQLNDHEINSRPFEEPRGKRAPIDLFFRSLAEKGSDPFAVILTGAGSDGAIGVRAVKEAGGIVLVQDPEEADYPSMPRSAIATGAADFILPIAELAQRLAELAREQRAATLGNGDEEVLQRIVGQLRVRTGHDFSKYKRSTLQRRVLRRAQVARKERLAEYYDYLRANAEEAQALFGELLISVTTFFRDPQAFEALAKDVIPKLFEGREAGQPIRVWVPGCATGEEAYSLGMLLLEQAARSESRPEIQIFASDLDAGALALARQGLYPAAIEADVSEDRLRRFLTPEGEHYRVKRELRDLVLFASHSLLRDPPFSHLDLISCRNLLIYLERPLQQEVITTFHYALNPSGHLFLGSSETADHPDGLFRPLNREAHIFQSVRKRGEAHPTLPRLTGGLGPFGHARQAPPTRPPVGTAKEGQDHRAALERAAPPSILVDDHHRALHLSETAGRFLQPSGGPLTADFVELVRPELRLDLRSALDRALLHGESALTLPVLMRVNGGDARRVCIQVRPAFQTGEDGPRQALVLFLEGESLPEAEADHGDPGGRSASEAVRRLTQELRITQDRLRVTQEDSQAANEELRAANEELQSINEEYRSTAEELETSKEELQSINEELQTVNNELKLKFDAVSRANSDLQNLMAATDVGTLFLDQGLRIKRFTPHLTELFNITETDEGRPITDFTHQLEYEDMARDARTVLRNLTPVEREIRSRADGWFLMRIRPYRTTDDKIDGVVFTFVDITERRRIEQALRTSEERLRHESRLVEQSRTPMFVWDVDGGIARWNRGAQQLYGYSDEEAVGSSKQVLLKTEVPGSNLDAVMRALLDHGVWSGELVHTAKDGRRITVESEMELAILDGRRLVLESTRDVTERRIWERRQELMVGELSHRVRNTLAVVQSLAGQTVRSASSPKEFVDRFNGRLMALAKAHQLLVDPWKGADIEALAREQLAPYVEGKEGAVTIDGPSVALEADIAVPLSLVLHELATNAVKYGALSVPGGRVELAWNLDLRGDLRWIVLNWRETDGPLVNEPAKSGFGSRLIERSLPNARVRRAFQPEGVTCVIEIPLPGAAR